MIKVLILWTHNVTDLVIPHKIKQVSLYLRVTDNARYLFTNEKISTYNVLGFNILFYWFIRNYHKCKQLLEKFKTKQTFVKHINYFV